MSCDACKTIGNDGKSCWACGEAKPHRGEVMIAAEIKALRLEMSRDAAQRSYERECADFVRVRMATPPCAAPDVCGGALCDPCAARALLRKHGKL